MQTETDASTAIVLPRPHAGQRRVITEAARFNVLECGRRFGKTTLGERLLIGGAAMRKCPVAWFAPTYKLLTDVWREVVERTKPGTKSVSQQERRIELVNGGVIDFWSLDQSDAGRGRKYGRVVVDEAGIIRDLESAWQGAIRPTLADLKGDAWFLGTPKGHNFFHRLFAKGQSGEGGWRSWRLPTTDNPTIDPEEIEAARRDMPDTAFRQEFLGIPADDGGNPFGLAAIRQCVSVTLAEPIPGRTYVGGVDLAKSQDWSVVVILDQATGDTVALERWQSPWDQTMLRIQRIASKYNNAQLLVDQTGVGDPVVEQLQRMQYL